MNSKKKLALLLLGNAAVFITLYFVCVMLEWIYITAIYVAVATVLAVIFIVYNRGFAAKNATPDQLPDTMTLAEKKAFIQEGHDRLERSRWMLTVLIPLILAIAADLAYLYIFPYIQEMFS